MRIRLDGVGERNIPCDAIFVPWSRFSARIVRKKLNSTTTLQENSLAPTVEESSSGTYKQGSPAEALDPAALLLEVALFCDGQWGW